MPVFKEERLLDLSVNEQEMPTLALGSPASTPIPSAPIIPTIGGIVDQKSASVRGLSNSQLSEIAKMPGSDTGPNLVPLSEVVANKRYNTYVRGMDLENIYGLQQSWYSQLANSAVKFAGTAVGTFAQGFATIPNTVSAISTGAQKGLREGVAELSGINGYESSIDNWLKNMDDAFPNYYTRKERENPYLSAIPFMPGSANFWGDKIFRNLGFTVGAIGSSLVQDAVVGFFTGGVGATPLLAGQLGKASLWLNKIFTGATKLDATLDLAKGAGVAAKGILNIKNLGNAAEGVRLLDGFRYATALYGSSRTEAALEARDTYRILKEELTREYVNTNGKQPDAKAIGEIDKYATDGMNTRFGVNMALLTLSNSVQFGNFLKSFTTSASRGISTQLVRDVDDIGKIGMKNGSMDVFEKVVPATKVEKAWNIIKPKIENIFAEGIYEEGGQFATEKGVYDYYTRKYKNLRDPKNAETWDSVNQAMQSTVKGLHEQFSSEEGIENMIIGALSSLITGSALGKLQKRAGGITADQKLQSTVNILNNYGLTGILSDNYNSTVTSAGIAKDMDEAVKTGNVFKYKNLKDDMFFNFVTSRIPIGMHDVTLEQLKMLKDLDKEEFEKTFGTDFNSSNKKTVNQYVDSLILHANSIKKVADSLNATFVNPYNFKINPTTPEEAIENQKHSTFNDYKTELTRYASIVPEMNNRTSEISEKLSEINSSISTSVLKRVTDFSSLQNLVKEYQTKAIGLEKTISETTPVNVARDTRNQTRKLRTLSEKINLAITNGKFDEKLFNDLLNFEINNQDVNAEKIIGPEVNSELLRYGIDLNKIDNTKKRAVELFEDLSSEEGFNKFFKQAEDINEEDIQEPVEVTSPSEFNFKNYSGQPEALEKDREYEFSTDKKATVKKIDEENYEVILPDGSSTYHKSKEDADIAAEEANQKLESLKKVKILNLNDDGSVKVEDANGDVYDISLDKLQGYQKVKTEQEKLEKIKDDVEQQQKELELSDSGTVAAVPFLDDSYKGNPEDFRKYWGLLFWSTTSASEDRDADSKKPHAQRSIAFLNNVKKFPNKGSIRVMLVTPKQEDALGLTGLHNLSMGEDIKRDASGNVIISDTNNALVAAVYVEQQGSEYYFVNKEGKRIGKVGDQVDLNQVVFSTMPDTSLFWNEGGKGAERYRVQEKKEAEEMSQRWTLKRKELFNLASDKPEIYSFTVSNGIPVINDVKERNHVGGTLIDESRIKNQEGLIVVSTKGTLTHNGQSYKIGAGRAMIQYEDVFVPAVNHKFNKNQAESIYEVLRLLAADMQKQAANNQKIKFDPIYVKYLSNLLYWKKSEAAKGGANQMFIDSKMNLILGDKKYDITKLDQFKKEITDQLLEAYHTVNNKSLSSTEEAGINKFHERFVEFYVEEGQLKEREWTNYQTYLLSAKYPDGTARSANDTPITTFVAKPTDLVPYNFKQKYAILSETEFPALPVRPTAKTETPSPTAAPKGDVVKAGKYNVGTTEFVQNTYTEFKAIGPISFEAKLKNEKETQVSIGTDKATLDEIDKIIGTYEEDGEETPVLKAIRQQLGAKYNSDDARFSVIFYMRQVIEAYLNKNLSEKQEAPKQEAPPVAPSAPKVAPIKIGDAEFIPDGTTLYTSTKVFKNEAPVQFSVSLSEAGKIKVKVDPNKQTGNHLVAISEKPESLAVIENTLRTLLKENYNESSTPEEKVAEFAAFKILSLLEQQQAPPQAAPTQAPVTDIEAKKADVKKDRYYNSPVNRMVKVQKESENRNLTQEEIDEIEQVIEKAKELGWDRDRLFRQLTSMGYSYALGNNPEGFKNYLEDRLSGKTNIKVTSEYNFFKQLDAELAALEAKPAVEEDVIESTKEIQARLFEDLGVTSKIITDVYLGGNHYLETEDGKFYIINDINSGYMPELAKEVTREQIIKPFRTEAEWKKVGIGVAALEGAKPAAPTQAPVSDIERRMQDELSKFKTSNTKTDIYNIPILLDPSAKARGDKQEYISREVFDIAYANDNREGAEFQTAETLIRRGGYTKGELFSGSQALLKPEIDKINVKYAKLAALEGAKSTSATFTPTTPHGVPTGTPLTTAPVVSGNNIEGTNARGTTYKAEVTEKDGLKFIKYSEFMPDGKRISKGGRIMTPTEFIKEYNITDQDYLDSLEGATEIRIYEVRTGKDGKQDIDVQGTFPEGNVEFSVAGKEEAPTPPPVESAPKKKKGGKKHDDNGEYRLVEVKPSKKEKISQADIEAFKQWHAEVAPNLPYEISERIFMLNDGRRAYGMFVDGVAKFYRGAIRGTEYHEVFEGIWGAFLTSEEKQAILDELKAKSGTFTDRETGKKIRWDEATDKQIKERIADDFAEYRLGKLPARSLSEKIVRFFKNIIEFFKKIISKPLKVDQLFDDIDRGRFKNYVVPDSAKYAVPEYRAVEGLTETDTRLYVEDMTSLIFQHMFGSNKSLYDIQKLTDKDLYDYVLQKYQESEKIDDTDADFLSTKQFDDLFTKTKEFLRQFKIEFEEGLVGDVNNNEADNRSYAPEPFSTDWKKHSGYPIKLLLGTLIRTKPSGKLDSNNISTSQPEWSELNGFQLLNFSKAFATVMDKLHNTSSVKRLIEKVVNLASLNSDYYRLLGRLKLNNAIKIVDGVISVDFSGFEAHDWRLFIQFYQTFTKQKPTALVQYMSGDNVYTSPSNLFTAAEELKNDWLSDIKLLAKKKESLIYFNSDTKRYQVGDISKIPTTTPEQKIDFLNKLGITFPLSTYLRLSVKKEIGEKSEQEKFNDAVSSIQKYISKDKDIASITGDALKIDTPIKRLAELYVRVENPPHETTRPNIEGEMVNEYAENNHVSVFENEMNEATTLDALREKRPELNDVFSESSVTLKKGGLFYDEDGNQIKKFKVNVIEGNKDIDGGKDTKVSRLSRGDAAVLQFNQNLKGDYYILVPADSSTEWMINLGNNISYDDVVNGRAWNKIYTIFRNYLNDEVKLAMSDRSYLKNTAPRAQELRFFKELLPEEMVERIHKDIKDDKSLSEINKYINENIEKVNSSVKSFIEDSSQDMLNDLMTFKRVVNNENTNFKFSTLDGDFAKAADVDKNNLTKKELNDIMMFRNINYVINNIEMHKVIFGDPYQFKIKNGQLDETKRIKSYLSPRRTTVDFAELNTALNQNRNFAGDILLTENDLGHHEFSSSINTVTLSDVEVAGTIYANSGMTTETDGFSFMMDTTYRELKIKNGQWIDEKAEPWHQWQMAYTRNKLAKKGDYVYTNEKLKAQDEKMISKPAPKHMVEVLKTIVTGNKANKTYFDNILDKFSQMPVYYSMVEGTNLEKMYVKMWKEKIGYAVYESGRKVGAEALHSVYNKDGEFNNETFTGIVQVPWKALGVQVETTYEEFHNDLTRGSQTTKISTIDLFDNGVATSDAADKEYKRYVTILNAYHENGTRELFDKLGLVHLGNGQFEIADPVALSESLKHELLRRDASDNVRYAIELDENKQFRVPFESSNAYIQIRDIIFSMVDKAVNSPKMHGSAYVEVPVTMFEKLGSSRSLVIKKEVEKGKFTYTKITKEEYVKLSDAEKKNVYLTDDTLKMPTKEDPYMEVMLPHWFREKLPKKFNTDEKILTYLNSTEDGRKLLRGIGFRIPTQALSSIAPIRVKGFLPQFAGHTVVVPSEITTMAGSDFDIDKMFIYLKSFYLDAAGDIRIVSLIDNSEGPTKEFYKNVYESTIQKEIDKIQRFDEFRDKAVDIFEKLEQFEEITLDNLEQLSEEDFEFYTTHAVLLNEMVEQAEEERLSPKDYILDQISKLDNKKDKLTQKMLNDDVKNKYIKKMYKRALENEYYDSLEKLITLPENYERNIAPVDDAGLKEVATELEKLTGDVGENVKNRLLSASYMTKLRHAFITAKRWVGIAAVNLTGHSNAQKTALYLDTDRFANLSKSEKSILGDGRVALPHNTVKVGNREHVSMSGRLTADGKNIYISSRLSGYATTFVDVAKDPYIMKIIKSELAVGTFMFLERIGAGETIPFFMNQPIIRKYLEQLDESNFRSLFNGEQISYILSEFATTDSLLEETQLNVSLKSLKENIENYRDGKTDDAYNAMQQKIFMEFLKYAKMAEYSFKLTQASNYDTTRFRSGNSLFKKQTRTDVASDTNIFSSVDNVLDSTHLGEQAYYLDLAVEAVGEYLQLDKDGIRKNITDDILRPYAENTYLSDDKYEAIGLTVSTSLLDFIIQTKTGLNSEIANLTSESETSAVTLLMRAKEKFPNDDLLQLLEPRQARTGGPWTIKLKGNAKASGYDENYFIGRMREIRDNADPETQELTTKLYKALVKLSILQGSKQSAMSIKNIIPAEDYEKEIGDAVRNLKYTPEMDAFKLGMFYRNQWKNDDIFKKITLNYNRAQETFSAIKELKISTFSRSVLKLKERYNMKNVSSDYLKMDRFIVDPDADEYTEGVIDLLTSNKYTPKEYKTMLAKGETAPKEILGFEKVKYPDGSPLIQYDKDGNRTFIYKRINLYGDAGYVAEYYSEFKKSVLKNGTSPIEREADNNDLIRHFTSKEVVMPNQEPITGTDMVTFTPEETEAPPFDITPTAPVSSVEITKSNYTREDVRKNPNTAYVFTENTHSITAFPNTQGGGSAIIRPEPNAFAIVTKKKYDYNTRENVDYSDTPEDFAEFTEVNTRLIDNLRTSGKSKIVFPQGFATDKAKMPTRFAEWLQKALLDNFGLVTELNSTKTGLISKEVVPSYYEITGEKAPLTYDQKIEKLNTIRGNMIVDFYGKFFTHTSARNISEEFYLNISSNDPFYVELREWLFDYRKKMLGDLITGDLDMDASEIIEKYTLHLQGKSFDKYQYYGAPYTIVLKNGVGVDVVGYKGKDVDKQKLLNAYNTNPNVDPQNGKPFRKEAAAPVQQPVSSQPVSDKPIFAYKERSIETQFILTEGQRNALSELIDFATSKEDAITLQGPAGTGKTAVIGYLQKYFGGSYNFVYMAPTHAAVAELASATVKVGNKSLPMTVASGFRMVYDPITKTSQPVIANKLGKRLGLRNNIVVVDESSMLSSKDYEMVSRALKSNNVKVIYMGDIMQIPEVDASNPVKKKVSRAFTENRQLYLTQVMRTSSDSILEMLENIRNNVNDKIPIIPSETGELRYLKSSEFNSLLAEAVENEPEDTVVIDYTNRGVSDYNKKIRESLGRTGPLQKGDVVVGYLGYASKQIEKANLANSIRYVVTDVTKDGPTYNVTLFSKKLDNLSKLGVSNVTGIARTTYVPLSRNEVFNFDDISVQDMEKNNQRLSGSFENLHQAKQYALSSNTGAAWAQFYREMETMSLNMASTDLGNDYVYNPSTKRMELYDNDKHRELVKTFPELKMEKGIDFGHAITIHKSQGSTVKNVFFNASSLPKSYLSKLYVGDDQVGTEKHALLYVGVSRASGFLGINSENPENFYSPAITTFDSLTEFTPEEKTTILTNFAAKHNLTEAAAKDYINSAIANKGKAAIISKLKECY